MNDTDRHLSFSIEPKTSPDVYQEVDPFIQLLIEYRIFEFPLPAHEIVGFEVIDEFDPHLLHSVLNDLAMLVSDYFGAPEEARTTKGLCLSWVSSTGSTLQVKSEARSESAVAFTVELTPPTSH